MTLTHVYTATASHQTTDSNAKTHQIRFHWGQLLKEGGGNLEREEMEWGGANLVYLGAVGRGGRSEAEEEREDVRFFYPWTIENKGHAKAAICKK